MFFIISLNHWSSFRNHWLFYQISRTFFSDWKELYNLTIALIWQPFFSPLPQKNPCLQMEGSAFITEKGKKKGDEDWCGEKNRLRNKEVMDRRRDRKKVRSCGGESQKDFLLQKRKKQCVPICTLSQTFASKL